MLLLGLALAVAYRFPVGTPITYHADLKFDGYLPIMGIGEGKAEVTGDFQVLGKTDSTATAELTQFGVTLNGDKIPLDIDDAKKFVPGGTFTYTPLGDVTKWDAPDVTAPIRIPGLDLKHLPQALILPVNFPAGQPLAGKSFTFTLNLTGGKAEYTITPGTAENDQLPVSIKLHQTSAGFEDSANQVVDKKDAVYAVSTDVTGAGTALFDLKLGRFVKFHTSDLAVTKATEITSKEKSTRKLKREISITS